MTSGGSGEDVRLTVNSSASCAAQDRCRATFPRSESSCVRKQSVYRKQDCRHGLEVSNWRRVANLRADYSGLWPPDSDCGAVIAFARLRIERVFQLNHVARSISRDTIVWNRRINNYPARSE